MRSYWACVPTNFTQTIPARYCISTTRRYLLPPTLNTTRLLPQMLAFAYWSLMSCGDRHAALTASSYQLCSGPRAALQPGRSQKILETALGDNPHWRLKAAVSQATGNTRSEIDRLLAVGARRILVANRTPREALENDNDLNGIDLNRALAGTVTEAAKRSGADIRVFDAYASVAEMMRNPSRFGFEQVNALCIQLPACANETYESGLKTANAYVNWDAAHKTTRVHQLLADRMLGMLKP